MNERVERAVASFLGPDEIDWEKLKPVVCFVILWNRLEAPFTQAFSASKLVQITRQVVSAPSFRMDNYQRFSEYFKQRYSSDARALEMGEGRSIREAEIQMREKFDQLRTGMEQSDEERMLGTIFVPYRIRNNLFHGNKETEELYHQTELFEMVNELICQFYEDDRNR